MNDEQKARYAKLASESYFFGEPVAEMDREELLAMVGWLLHQHHREAKERLERLG